MNQPEFTVHLSKSKSTDEALIFILSCDNKRIGAMRAIIVDKEQYPIIGDEKYYWIDQWEMVEGAGIIRCLEDPNTTAKGFIEAVLCKAIYPQIARKIVAREGHLIHNFEKNLDPFPKLWEAFVAEGKATIVDETVPIIVMPPIVEDEEEQEQ